MSVAVLMAGIGYAGEWARSDWQAQKDWFDVVLPSARFKVRVPRNPEIIDQPEADTVRSAARTWEIGVAEIAPIAGGSVMAAIYGPSVAADDMSGIAKSSLQVGGPGRGVVETVQNVEHRLGSGVEYSGTIYRGSQKRYRRELVVADGQGLVSLAVEANANQRDLVDFLYREVEETFIKS